MSLLPETRYARSGELDIAYQITGEGPLDVVLTPGDISHLDLDWEEPYVVRFLNRLSSFCRLIRFDKRGTGLSDRVAGLPTLEQRMDDLRAVIDAAASRRPALLGFSEGGPMCVLFATTYPERTAALILCGAFARFAKAMDYPWGISADDEGTVAAAESRMEQNWGKGLSPGSPSLDVQDRYRAWRGRLQRSSATPSAMKTLFRMNLGIDVREILPVIAVPTLVLHRTGDRMINVGNGRYLGSHIPGALYVEVPGEDHVPWGGDSERVCAEIQTFLTGARSASEPDRVLATVLFTDIVGSTERAAEMGDRAWKELLGHHRFLVRQQLERHRGREINTTGDGFLASFDGPARAVRCARAIVDSAGTLGIQIRVGIHTGECEVMGDDLGGIAVHIGARVAAQAMPDEVLVSSTVKDLVAGAGLNFESRGLRTLKGVPGEWRLFAAV